MLKNTRLPLSIIVLALLGSLWGAATFRCHQQRKLPAQEMNEALFWGLVEKSIHCGWSQSCQVRELRTTLSTLTIGDLLRFETAFRSRLRELSTWDIYIAGYIIKGGMSEDDFLAFRSWIIARGRSIFANVRPKPDSLADVIPAKWDQPVEFEDFMYVAGDLWTRRTGLGWEQWSRLVRSGLKARLGEEPVRIEKFELERKYPRAG